MNVPAELRTARLRLRPMSAADADALERQWNHPDVGRFLWDGQPVARATVEAYRWCMDIEDLDDDTPRTNELTDLRHWSQWSLGNQLANLGMEAIHPRAGRGLRQAKIPLCVRNTFDREDEGTLICADYLSDRPRVEIVSGVRELHALQFFEIGRAHV